MLRSLVTVAALLLAFSTLGGTTSAAPKGGPWGADYFPNVLLVTHEGKTVRFYDDLLKDKRVLINFIFTSCEKACPLDTAKLAGVQKSLGPRVGRDIFMYSITLDPEHDTPEALKAYAEKYGAGPGWLFLTGTRVDIDKVRFKFGERGEKEGHENTVRVGNVASRQWMKLPLKADRDYLVTEIGKTLDPNWYAGKSVKSFEAAPRVEISGKGQLLFQSRCAACHIFGKGDVLGPDLTGVTARRERAWLVRYLTAPDQMRASKDPIAVALAEHTKVPMPNLTLTREEVADLMEFLETRSAAVEGKVHDHAGHDHAAPSR
jgi:protein SCO1